MNRKAICLILCLPLLWAACAEKTAQQQAPPPPTAVSVVKAETRDVPIYVDFVGQTAGAKDIAIRARVEGFLEGLHFQEGAQVQKGDRLYTLESQPFDEKVAARKSAVAEATTMLVKAKADLDRIRPLAKINAVSKSDLDEAVAAFEAAGSSLEAAEANLRAVEIQLGYTEIRSPIDGIIGKTNAKVGDFVGKDPNPVILNTVSQVDTILVSFFITETQYLELARAFGDTKSAQEQSKKTSLELILADGSIYGHKGQPDFVDRQVDATTGAILVQASFPNPSKLLRPGQFVRVRAQGQNIKDAILIPQRCVMELQGLYNVFVVTADNTVETREVSVGPKVDSLWLISDGLKAGESVIYEGLQKVADGATVDPTVVQTSSEPQQVK